MAYICRGGSKIPHRRGRQPFRRGVNIQIFPKNCMKSRKCWSIGGGAWGAPLGSATDKFALKLIPLVTTSNLFSLEVAPKC